MRILILADGRSPTTQNWLKGLLGRGQSVSLLSSFPCAEPLAGLESFRVLPIAYSQLAGGSNPAQGNGTQGQITLARRLVRRFRGIFLTGRYWLGPLSVRRLRERLMQEVAQVQPDLVHALRIPYEGMLASATPAAVPLVVSTWGNDLTLHARGSPWMRSLTIATLQRADGLISDTQRDVRLAHAWGFTDDKPVLVVPGAGGLPLDAIRAVRSEGVEDILGVALQPDQPLIVNPRGIRPGSLRTDTFFQAIPMILNHFPEAVFACPGMAGQPEALGWMERLNLDYSKVRLLPSIPQASLWALFKRAQVMVSVSQHDGTPNSVLEGMACGSFPVAGDIESLREWITPGVNGLLVSPADPNGLADAICLVLENDTLRARAARENEELVARRADIGPVMQQVEDFYHAIYHRTTAAIP